ncbi:MAG TPA: hypothetical protein VJ867_08170 [Gemmatimonadaceae bacterium]|nr:hypothetical protein [Gemmatimonadaceae bacterium]
MQHSRRLTSRVALTAATAILAACAGSTGTTNASMSSMPSRDPRVGLKAGLYNAQEATWNMRVVSETRPSKDFEGVTNSDLAFLRNFAIQGSYNGYQLWDISDPAHPTLRKGFVCPASQSDVSVYRNLLFVSGEGLSGRIDCGAEGVKDTVSTARLRGLRIFDISDMENPKNVGNVQTCRGSHTHTLLVDPKDADNVYIYISGSAGVRSPNELPGCISDPNDPNTARFRIEVIKVPLAHPEQAAIVSSPRIFQDLMAPPRHGETPEDVAAAKKALADAKARGDYTAIIFGSERPMPPQMTRAFLDSIAQSNGRTAPNAADSAALRTNLQSILNKMGYGERAPQVGPPRGPTQCHDITVYPAIGLAGGACEGYGFLLDIRDPAHPSRVAAVSDSNFSYWHSATFNNDGTKILFSDEWGGGGQPKCRATDPRDWGADALFTIVNRSSGTQIMPDGVVQDPASLAMKFQGYYKLPAPQTPQENCVAHNGSMIPVPGRDIMVQSWYQGGVSVFDWTDPAHPREIAFFDRGPVDSTRMASGGTWSAYWYNGVIVSSEISRGLDILELTPNPLLTQNEIDAAKTVRFDYYNTQDQQKFVWPASFALARAYVDQLERGHGLDAARVAAIRQSLASAESASGTARNSALTTLASQLDADVSGSSDAARVRSLATAVRNLAR